jgi:hypothetical protein
VRSGTATEDEMDEAKRRREREPPHIARLKAWSHRNQQLFLALNEAVKSKDRDVEEMLMTLIEKSADEYTDILRSTLPDDAARAAFDEDIEAGEKEIEAEMQRLDAEFEAAIEEYRATGNNRRLLAHIADTK